MKVHINPTTVVFRLSPESFAKLQSGQVIRMFWACSSAASSGANIEFSVSQMSLPNSAIMDLQVTPQGWHLLVSAKALHELAAKLPSKEGLCQQLIAAANAQTPIREVHLQVDCKHRASVD